IRLRVGGRDRTADLRAGRGVPLLPADGSAGSAELGLLLPGPVSAPSGAWVSLLVELDSTDRRRVPAAWLPDAVPDVPPPAEVEWAYVDPAGAPVVFGTGDVDDGTEGLRRSGVVRLRIPDAWRAG